MRWALLIVLVAVATGCGTVSRVTAHSPSNPTTKIESRATPEWYVERLDENTIELRKAWMFLLYWEISVAQVRYLPGKELAVVEFAAGEAMWSGGFCRPQVNERPCLVSYLDAEFGCVGLCLKPTLRAQLSKILTWGELDVVERRSVFRLGWPTRDPQLPAPAAQERDEPEESLEPPPPLTMEY
jgi:hypothetical protein